MKRVFDSSGEFLDGIQNQKFQFVINNLSKCMNTREESFTWDFGLSAFSMGETARKGKKHAL